MSLNFGLVFDTGTQVITDLVKFLHTLDQVLEQLIFLELKKISHMELCTDINTLPA